MSEIYLGDTPLKPNRHAPQGSFVQIDGEAFYRITHVDKMPPFFMSLVSGSDHWLFIASNGGLTAGRTNAESALFPYETEDKLMAHSDKVGSMTMVRLVRRQRHYLWEPYSPHLSNLYEIERNLYKNVSGSTLIFEEINRDLQLTWRTTWRTGERFGIVKTSWLHNEGEACTVELLDGIQNILPYGSTSTLQANFSNLLNAYKRCELDPASGLALFSLSATLTDQAEPSESLMATTAWQIGLDNPRYLLCRDQVDRFRRGQPITTEKDVVGKAGAYLLGTTLNLAAGQTAHWHIAADVNQDAASVVRLSHLLQKEAAEIELLLEDDIESNATTLEKYVAAADGLQRSADETTTTHHFANVMFNVMRGGIFNAGYRVDKQDLLEFMQVRNRPVLAANRSWFDALPGPIDIRQLYEQAAASGSAAVQRLCAEYLPLTFSRRHGDPSRPWNRFSINLRRPDGSPRLDYQGNWRDIFQNWEPLLLSFPAYLPGVIAKFLNATTADGYNPYRVTRNGIEWEVPEPDNPWANIGYWSDHQIIYLQKLLEISEQVEPSVLQAVWAQPLFAYANVPYRLRSYDEMLADWSNTIDFDWEREREIAAVTAEMGTDGRLLRDEHGQVIQVTMTEKLLVLLLAKLVNLVPDGGIWMNTQRPEWNDANNALVGKGLSVVTAAYLRRFIVFWRQLLRGQENSVFQLNAAVVSLFSEINRIFTAYEPCLAEKFDNRTRRLFMNELGAAATRYRAEVYQHGFPARQTGLSGQALDDLLARAQAYLDHTLRANRRPDDLYHAYNILVPADQEAAVEHLYLMLEGQVAILSSGVLTLDESLALLKSLRHSDLYRPNQHSYMLYPNRRLPGFREKNRVPAAHLSDSSLIETMIKAGDPRLLVRDEAGEFHFNGRFRNAGDLAAMLDTLASEVAYSDLVAGERENLLEIFEGTFNHRAFTGRSGTFFAYEGLGSIYWHMVSKLLLAVQENVWKAQAEDASPAVLKALIDAYYDIRQGLGFNKSPAVYGAFPTDPYSHTPLGGGARQPGMTGQVKEEILTRWGELGVFVHNGELHFDPLLLRPEEFLSDPTDFAYVALDGQTRSILLPAQSLAFTFCQTPFIYTRGSEDKIELVFDDGQTLSIRGSGLDRAQTRHLFDRDGRIREVWVSVLSYQ
ncbi:MAG: hypothetical protein QNJ45_22865 [Ardenticatenaceae bacterium]|nr:hypothetical protein [Ardenticatenaceae bacterium]